MLSPYPAGRRFGFTVVHDADSAYSGRLRPVMDAFDEYGLPITVTAFAFWADWARGGKSWSNWRNETDALRRYLAPRAVPLEDAAERRFYLELADKGHEIGLHTPAETSSLREDVTRAYEYFGDIFGHHPRVYAEHSAGSKRDAQVNEGSDPRSSYYNADLLDEYGSWIWLDDGASLVPVDGPRPYDVLSLNGTPFSPESAANYGIRKTFLRANASCDDGRAFLRLYRGENLDALEREGGLAIVYTHLNYGWLDPRTRTLHGAFRERLADIAGRNGWFAPAGPILDRWLRMQGVELQRCGNTLAVINTNPEAVDDLTLVATGNERLCDAGPGIRRLDGRWYVVDRLDPGTTLHLSVALS